MSNLLAVIMMIASAIVIVAVTLQDPKTDGLGAVWNKDKCFW